MNIFLNEDYLELFSFLVLNIEEKEIWWETVYHVTSYVLTRINVVYRVYIGN